MNHDEGGAVGAGAGPLDGVRVIELGTLLAGSFASRLLADFGADVIKVEDPRGGDPLRSWGQAKVEGRGLWWPVQSRNKRLVTLNLRSEAGQGILRDLAAGADVLIENFRPGTLERWGIGPDLLLETNPRLVIARISGYGQTGPYADRAGFASAGEAIGGLRHINGFPGELPPRVGVSLGDSLAAMFAAQGVLMALVERARTGRGQVVDTAINESSFALLESILPEYVRTGQVRGPSGTRLDGIAPSNLYLSRDNKWVVIAANADNLFARLAAAMGMPELAAEERFLDHVARGRNQDALDAIIADWARGHDAAEIDSLLNAAGVVCGPVYTIADIYADPHYRARDMFVPMEDEELGEIVGPGIVPKLSRTPGAVRFPGSWRLGAHNDEVYGADLGLDGSELARLKSEGVI